MADQFKFRCHSERHGADFTGFSDDILLQASSTCEGDYQHSLLTNCRLQIFILIKLLTFYFNVSPTFTVRVSATTLSRVRLGPNTV